MIPTNKLTLTLRLLRIALILLLYQVASATNVLLQDHFVQFDSHRWRIEGRGTNSISEGALSLRDCEAVGDVGETSDYELSFRARAPQGASEAQIWASVRRTARDSRYVIGVRGGNNNEIYIARYAPNGKQMFFGVTPLTFPPKPGEWTRVRIVVAGRRIEVFLNEASSPTMAVSDEKEGWLEHGGVSLGSGYLDTEFADVAVCSLGNDLSATSRVAISKEDDKQRANRRRQERVTYRPVSVEKLGGTRAEISLDGQWLFLPDYEWQPGKHHGDPKVSDEDWHVMAVPAFWTPIYNWCYDDKQGGSDRLVQLERERLGRLTFDWEKTKAAWYRHEFDLKEDPAGHRFELCFDAIAKVAEVWLNGHCVVTNMGMFMPVQVDVTPWVKQGPNLVAVQVGNGVSSRNAANANKVEAVAVTVPVTERMLKGLPQGIYVGNPGGIWQPVKLVVHRDVQVKDVFFQPRLDGAKVELTLENQSTTACEVVPQIDFTSLRTGEVIAPKSAFSLTALQPGEASTITLDMGKLTPELWTPAKPNLYTLRVALNSGGRQLDERKLEVGFRTFEARKDGRLYLNGKPYWLRGGSHTPMPTNPNDRNMADKFTKLMHDGNVRVTRTTCSPWNELWLSCADRNGVGVSQEGPWPWLMLGGKMPPPEVLECWRREHAALIKEYRNHPSILFWTVNNESYYVKQKDPKDMEERMGILSSTIKEMRALDPTRPICPDSGGVLSMVPPFYDKMAKEKGFDYGDMDDKHEYTSWYMKTFFSHYPNQDYADGATGQILKQQLRHWVTPGRPMISQEMATGYPNAEDGHAIRKYIFEHMVPQAWVGDYAYEHNDPNYLLGSIAFNTKELAETLRCYYRDDLAGVLHFALNTWYQNLFEADRIRPYCVASALATGLQPVLVSARLYGRHFYAGDKQSVSLFVVNDDEDGLDLKPSRLVWSVELNGKSLASGEQLLPAVTYYSNHKTELDLALPAELPRSRVDAQLVLKLFEGDKLVSTNQYELVVARKDWVQTSNIGNPLVLDEKRASGPLWHMAGLTPDWTTNIPEASDERLWVVCDYTWVKDDAQRERLHKHLESGGHVILLHPDAQLAKLFPDLVKSFRPLPAGEIATMRVPESPVFDGIEVMDLRWFDTGDRNTPIVTRGDFRLAESPQIEVLAKYTPTHAYLFTQKLRDEIEGSVIFTIRQGRGQVWVTQLAHDTGVRDPIAARVLRNLIAAACRPARANTEDPKAN